MFKMMTWNVEHLFRVGAPSGPSTPAIFEAKIKGLASTINAEQPDALALQEIGDPAALDDLVQQLLGTWQRRVSAHPDSRQIRVAWLTRRPSTQSRNIFNFPPHLGGVQVDDGGGTLSNGRKELIGHILVSAVLVKPLVAIFPEPLASIATDPTLRCNQPSSDHAPVIATFANL